MHFRNRLLLLSLTLLAAPAIAVPCDLAASDRKVVEGEQQTDLEAMKRLAVEAIAMCDTNPRAHNLSGNALEALGDLAGAEAGYARASALDPSWYIPALGLGDVARKRGAPEEARTLYTRALRLVKSPEERKQVESSAALLPAPKPGEADGYAFKDADVIERGFRIGERLTQATGTSETEAPSAGASGVGRSGGVVTEEAPWTPAAGAKPTNSVDTDIVQAPDGRIGAPLPVYFVVGTTDFTEAGRRQAEALAKGLSRRQTGAEQYVIEGHASTEGEAAANTDLSNRRAQAFRDFLISMGMKATQFEVKGFGEASPIIEGGVENKAKSRRVVVIRRADR